MHRGGEVKYFSRVSRMSWSTSPCQKPITALSAGQSCPHCFWCLLYRCFLAAKVWALKRNNTELLFRMLNVRFECLMWPKMSSLCQRAFTICTALTSILSDVCSWRQQLLSYSRSAKTHLALSSGLKITIYLLVLHIMLFLHSLRETTG